MEWKKIKWTSSTSNGPWEPSLEVRKSCRKIVDEDITTNFRSNEQKKYHPKIKKKNLSHFLIGQKLKPFSQYHRCPS
jgi:hypothetical protein